MPGSTALTLEVCIRSANIAAVAFAGVLVAVMRSGEVQSILTELVRGALSL